jgi:hypothetical protein
MRPPGCGVPVREGSAAVWCIAALSLLAGCSGASHSDGSAVRPVPPTETPAEVPLHVTVFVDPDDASEGFVQYLADPAFWNDAVSEVWAPAGIEIEAGEIEIVPPTPDGSGLGTDLLTSRESLRACSTDTRWAEWAADHESGREGIEVLVGGRIATASVNRFAVGGTCGPFDDCRERIEDGDAILFDGKALIDSPASLPHELGHMFGLDHAESPGSCGSDLVPVRDSKTFAETEIERRTANLMRTDLEGSFGMQVDQPRSSDLTPEQQRRALQVVCASTENLGARPSGCGDER